jgi:hypothetical protein
MAEEGHQGSAVHHAAEGAAGAVQDRMGSSRSRPNWPDKPNNRLDKARKALVEALLELGVIHATCR